MNSLFFKTLVLSGGGFLLTYAVAWTLTLNNQGDDGDSVSSLDGTRSSQRINRSAKQHSEAAIYMNVVKYTESKDERMKAVISLAKSLDIEQFAQFISSGILTLGEGPELDVLMMLIMERWAKEAPGSFITWADKSGGGIANRALKVMAAESPELIIDHYRRMPNNVEELRKLELIATEHPVMALERLRELDEAGSSLGSSFLVRRVAREIAKKDDVELERAMAEFSSDVRREIEKEIIGARLIHSFESQIQELYSRPDGWGIVSHNLSNNKELSSKLLNHIDALPEKWISKMVRNSYSLVNEGSAKDWFEADLKNAGFSSSQATRIWARALSQIVKKEPEYTLANLAESNVSGDVKSKLIATALDSAESNPEQEATLIALLDSEEDRLLAEGVLEVRKLQDGNKMVASPAEWLDVFGNMNEITGFAASAMENQIGNWSATELAELRSDFGGLPVEQQQKIAEAVTSVSSDTYPDVEFSGDVVRALVTNNMDFEANGEFSYSDPIRASSRYAVLLFNSDPEAATKWLSSLPDGEAKLWASKNVAANWRQYDPKAVDAWITKLPEDVQQEVLQHLEEEK